MRVKTGHGSKHVIFKRVNRITGQTDLTHFTMSNYWDGKNNQIPILHDLSLPKRGERVRTGFVCPHLNIYIYIYIYNIFIYITYIIFFFNIFYYYLKTFVSTFLLIYFPLYFIFILLMSELYY